MFMKLLLLMYWETVDERRSGFERSIDKKLKTYIRNAKYANKRCKVRSDLCVRRLWISTRKRERNPDYDDRQSRTRCGNGLPCDPLWAEHYFDQYTTFRRLRRYSI